MSDNPIYSEFWLDQEKYSNYLNLGPKNTDESFSIDLIQLASVRRIIANYVDILTGTSVPVYFKAVGDSYNIGGKEIYITTAIRRKKDFDQAVGLALHEAAHTLLTDFDLFKTMPFNAPKSIWEFGRKHKISKLSLERFLKTMFNIIEDWYIDDWVISKVPGYLGYYEASYDVCFNSPTIDDILMSDSYRFPSLSSYELRIINFCNPITDLKALPGLEEIAKEISISTISRLGSTKDRIKLAYKITEMVLENVQEYHSKSKSSAGGSGTSKTRLNVASFFQSDKTAPGKEAEATSSAMPFKSDKKSDTDRTVQDIVDVLGTKPKKDDENKSMSSQVSNSPNKEISKEIKKAVEQQVQYVHGHSEKQELQPTQKTMLDLIEKHGIVLVYVPVTMQGNEAAMRVGCVVVKKLTMELIKAGQNVFPMANYWTDMDGVVQPDVAIAEAVKKGIQLGTKLGRRLVIRREINQSRIIRKRSGKINRRLLYSAGFQAEDIFENIKVQKYNQGSLHITVDASTSMSGKKWLDTMVMCVAICKATSMVDNIHVTVSFRSTKMTSGVEMPYIVQAYDSKVDKFSKVKNLFCYLRPNGCTPEGLAFGAIMNLFTKAVPDEEDRYFLNISDGEPFFQMKSPMTGHAFHYGDGNGVEHTRNQVNKIRRLGIHILSYYIQSDPESSFLGAGHDTKKNFQLMYGRDSRFIKSDSVVELAKTVNELFLKGQ